MSGSAGARTATVTASMARAVWSPSKSLTLPASRVAVVKSGVCRFSSTSALVANPLATLRSTIAPPGIRPALGMFPEIREPSLPDAPKPPTTRLPWAMA